MSVVRPFRQQRKTITGVALGVWLFALFVGIAHACGWVEPSIAPVHAVAASASQHSSDEGTPVGCEQFCKSDIPVVTKLPPLGDQPDAQPLIVADRDIGVAVALPPAFQLAPAAHPPPDVTAYLRFAHLRL